MRLAAMILAALSLTSYCDAEEFNPFDGPKPIAVFIQTDPWKMVIGSDTPRVAVYENGDVIFAKAVEDRLMYHHTRLNYEKLNEVRARLKPVLALDHLERWYDVAPNVTDMPQARFYIRDGDRKTATSVYGLMAPKTRLPAYTEFSDETKPSLPPEELLKLHKWLCELDYPESEEWTPRYVEIMLWEYSYAPDTSIQWPANWPKLDSERAFKRGDQYSVFLDGSLLPEIRGFLAKRKEKGTIEAGGGKWAMSYRFTFPQEPTWHEALAFEDESSGDNE